MFEAISAENLGALAQVMKVVFYAFGVVVVGHGIWKLTEASSPGKQEGTLGLRSIFIGGALMSIGPIIATISNSMGITLSQPYLQTVSDFGMIEPYVSSSSGEAAAKYTAIVNSFVNMCVLFGYWSVGKGMLMLKKTSDGAAQHLDEGVLSGITHIIFGCMLVNIRILLPAVLVDFFGFDETAVQRIIGSGLF